MISNLCAGAANYKIKCESASKRTTIEASIPGCCGMELTFTIDGKSLKFMTQPLTTACINEMLTSSLWVVI